MLSIKQSSDIHRMHSRTGVHPFFNALCVVSGEWNKEPSLVALRTVPCCVLRLLHCNLLAGIGFGEDFPVFPDVGLVLFLCSDFHLNGPDFGGVQGPSHGLLGEFFALDYQFCGAGSAEGVLLYCPDVLADRDGADLLAPECFGIYFTFTAFTFIYLRSSKVM